MVSSVSPDSLIYAHKAGCNFTAVTALWHHLQVHQHQPSLRPACLPSISATASCTITRHYASEPELTHAPTPAGHRGQDMQRPCAQASSPPVGSWQALAQAETGLGPKTSWWSLLQVSDSSPAVLAGAPACVLMLHRPYQQLLRGTALRWCSSDAAHIPVRTDEKTLAVELMQQQQPCYFEQVHRAIVMMLECCSATPRSAC